MSPPTAPDLTPTSEPAPGLLDAVLAVLPIGLSVEDAAARRVFSNVLFARHAAVAAPETAGAAPPRQLAVETARLSVGGCDYTMRVSRDVTAQRDLEDDLFRRAYTDETTGLPNRAFFEHSVRDLLERTPDAPFALAFIDIDRFRQVNERFGYAAGDELLAKIGGRLSAELRATDLLARVGCDSFALLLASGEAANPLADLERLVRRLGAPFFITGRELFVAASVGVALSPAHGADEPTLRANADLALTRAKAEGRGGLALFDPATVHAASERLAMEQRLRAVLRERRLCCVFQPKLDFRSATVVGLEVLMRWRDERGALQPPGAILGLATDLGLMDEITHTLLEQTFEALDRIDTAFGPEVTVSVNIAARLAGNHAFMVSVADAIAATDRADRFMLELTEEAFLHKGDFQTRVMPMLKARGIKVSIDDFGTGYSSLSALADITADEVKVDRSFITDIHLRPRNQTILCAVESIGRALGMSVIVEGVETAEELAWIQAATGIRYAQGYYFARPMFIDDLVQATTLDDRRPAPARATSPNRQTGRRLR